MCFFRFCAKASADDTAMKMVSDLVSSDPGSFELRNVSLFLSKFAKEILTFGLDPRIIRKKKILKINKFVAQC